MEDKPMYGTDTSKIDFVNLTPEENQLANDSLKDLRDYLETTPRNKEDQFQRFFDLFNRLCQDRIKLIIFSIFFILSYSCKSQNENIDDAYYVKVIGVKDGDSIEVLDQNKNLNFVVRLAEIDCPEYGQPFSAKAKEFTSNKIYGKIVKLDIIDTDQYGRYIGKIYYENIYLSAELLKMGLAWVFRRYSDNSELIDLENKAKNQKIGIWSETDPVAPWEWRKKNVK